MTGKDYFATGFSSTDRKIGHCKLVAGKKNGIGPNCWFTYGGHSEQNTAARKGSQKLCTK
jgi:hypothetical protein